MRLIHGETTASIAARTYADLESWILVGVLRSPACSHLFPLLCSVSLRCLFCLYQCLLGNEAERNGNFRCRWLLLWGVAILIFCVRLSPQACTPVQKKNPSIPASEIVVYSLPLRVFVRQQMPLAAGFILVPPPDVIA